MLFADYQRYQYARSPLIEVICQLRFPTILTINTTEPPHTLRPADGNLLEVGEYNALKKCFHV